jgi:2-amino-4-hydroxy-6-hydroxymethyldihydropteridine diphosphokinase
MGSTEIAALVALGSNLPGPDRAPPLETCRQAVAALDLLPDARLVGLSRWYLTAPMPPSGQPPYVNAVAHLMVDPEVAANPGSLLERLLAIETRLGRVRGAPNAARTLDLDLIAVGDLVRAAPDPILPHPRAHERAFVLFPLRDVIPGWVHPGLGLTVSALIAALPPQEIAAL